MRYIKIKDESKTYRSGRSGTLEISYPELIETLGEPSFGESGDGKIRAEWVLEFEDGTIATIYDYKRYGTPLEEVQSWSIGGFGPESAIYVNQLFS